MIEEDAVLLLFLLFFCAALVCDALWPAQRKRGWDNSRAATQKDVADVLKGGKRNDNQPNTTGLIVFLIVVLGICALALQM